MTGIVKLSALVLKMILNITRTCFKNMLCMGTAARYPKQAGLLSRPMDLGQLPSRFGVHAAYSRYPSGKPAPAALWYMPVDPCAHIRFVHQALLLWYVSTQLHVPRAGHAPGVVVRCRGEVGGRRHLRAALKIFLVPLSKYGTLYINRIV